MTNKHKKATAFVASGVFLLVLGDISVLLQLDFLWVLSYGIGNIVRILVSISLLGYGIRQFLPSKQQPPMKAEDPTAAGEHSASGTRNSKLTIGIIIGVIGIALIIVSQTFSFTKQITYSHQNPLFGRQSLTETVEDTNLRNGILYGGIGGLVVGGILIALDLKKKQN